jgi:antitoxin component of MazEF toxin-antitoxin module
MADAIIADPLNFFFPCTDDDARSKMMRNARPPASPKRLALDSDTRYISNTYMKRKLVQAGGSLAVTLPAEVVQEFKLRKGMSVDVSVHPQTGAVTVRAGARYFERGKVTRTFKKAAEELLDRRSKVYRLLAR